MSGNGLATGCECSEFVTGGLLIQLERDPVDNHLVSVSTGSNPPRRTAVSKGFAERMEKGSPGVAGAPGVAEWSSDGRRLIIRADGREYAYRRKGVCSCGYVMIERE